MHETGDAGSAQSSSATWGSGDRLGQVIAALERRPLHPFDEPLPVVEFRAEGAG